MGAHNQHCIVYASNRIDHYTIIRDGSYPEGSMRKWFGVCQMRIDKYRAMLVSDALAQIGDYNTVINTEAA